MIHQLFAVSRAGAWYTVQNKNEHAYESKLLFQPRWPRNFQTQKHSKTNDLKST